MKKSNEMVMIFAAALLAAPAAQAHGKARLPEVRVTSTACAFGNAALGGQGFTADEAQDRDQEARDRAQEARDREQEARDRAREKMERDQEIYNRALEALDDSQWQKASEMFNQAIQHEMELAKDKQETNTIEGSLYWKAYAESKMSQRAEALATLGQLDKTYPRSRWISEAKQLQLEIQQNAGVKVSPESQSDDDLKLMAINGLLNSDPERAVPMLEKLIESNQSPKLKERALFVLSQSGSPRAREVVTKIAKGGANPDLQMKALNDLGMFGGKESRQTLADIYASSSDVRVKSAILRSFMIGGDRDRLLAAAKGEKSADLRIEAIRQLGMTGAQDQLWQLYQAEPSTDVKVQILRSMFMGGNADKLIEVARNEKNGDLRRAAIHSLGMMGAGKAGDALVSLYGNEKDTEARKAILNSMFIQGNVKGLIGIARQEKDPELKREAVQKLSLMHSKEATDYMMEILNK